MNAIFGTNGWKIHVDVTNIVGVASDTDSQHSALNRDELSFGITHTVDAPFGHIAKINTYANSCMLVRHVSNIKDYKVENPHHMTPKIVNHFASGALSSVIKKVTANLNNTKYTVEVDPFTANAGDVFTTPDSWSDIIPPNNITL